MIYVINIVTVAKKEDAYNEVATNLYPIIIKTSNKETLKNHLINLHNKIKNTLKSKYLYDNSWFYIREVNGDEFKWKINEIVKINYID